MHAVESSQWNMDAETVRGVRFQVVAAPEFDAACECEKPWWLHPGSQAAETRPQEPPGLRVGVVHDSSHSDPAGLRSWCGCGFQVCGTSTGRDGLSCRQ